MFCPQCGTNQSDKSKFCKSCGANLSAVRQAVTAPESQTKTDWTNTWVRYQHEMEKLKQERKNRESPEEKRITEIKAGVITSCAGIGLMVFLYFLMQGIIAGGQVPFGAAQILGSIWIAGLIPVLVGAGLLINGVFVSKKLIELRRRELEEKETTKRIASAHDGKQELSPSADWYELGSPKPSVTEHTTRQLENSNQME